MDIQLEFQHLTAMKRRAALYEFINRTKSRPCMDCIEAGRDGIWPTECMQFDHRPGEKKLGHVSRFVHDCDELGARREISKCDIVCANCHAIRTKRRVGQYKHDPEHRKRISDAGKIAQNRPDVKARKSMSMSKAMKAAHAKLKDSGVPWRKNERSQQA